MAFYLAAHKAEFGKDGTFSYWPAQVDHKEVVQADNLKDAQAAFDRFCQALPTDNWIVFGTWRGQGRTPRGLAKGMQRKLNLAATS